jgi:iron complex outermembrane receptor protein
LIFAFASISQAEEAVELEKTVVTATRTERAAKETPATISVITSEDIAKSGSSTVAEVLKSIPGITFYDYGGGTSGVQGKVVLRGHYHGTDGFGHILALVDGMPMVQPDSGCIYWDMIPLSNVERIEVVMGPGSALWGGNAVGGTINIITKKPSYEPQAEVSTKFGEYGMKHHSFYGQIMGKESWKKDLSIAVSVEGKEADGWRANSNYDIRNYWVRTSKVIEELDANINLTLFRSDKDVRYPGSISQEMWDADDLTTLEKDYYKHNYSDIAQYYQRLIFEKDIGESSLKANLYNYHKDYDLFYAFSFGGLCYDVDVDNIAGSLQYNFSLGPHSFVVGGDLENQDIEQDSCHSDAVYKCDRSNLYRKTQTDIAKYALYIQDSWKIFEPLEAILSLRWDKANFDNTGDWYSWSGATKTDAGGTRDMDGFSPKGSLLYKINENLNLYGSIGRAFRIPNPHDMFVGSGANPDLEAEKAMTYEIGTKYTTRKIAGSLAFYITKVEDLIVKSSPAFGAPYENIGETEHKGVEASLAYCIMNGLDINLSGDYTRAEVKENPSDPSIEGKYIDRIPEYKIALGLDYSHASGFFASFYGKQTGPFYMDDANEDEYDDYFVADAMLGCKKKFGKSEVNLSVGCNNLFDKKYAATAYTSYGKNKYYPGMPRYFFTKLSIKF